MSVTRKIIWGLIVIAIVVLLYLFTVGYLDAKKLKLANEFQETKKRAIQKNKELKVILKARADLEKNLRTKYKTWRILFRILLVLLWLAFATPFYLLGIISSIAGLFTYLGITSIIYYTTIFVSANDKNHLKEVIEVFEIRLQNWIYGKYINIEKDVLVLKEKIKVNNQILSN